MPKKLNITVDIKAEELRKKLNIKDGITPIKNVDYFDGKDAVVDTDKLALDASKIAAEQLKPLIPSIEQIELDLPKLGEPIRDSLELLDGDNRLDKNAIRGLDDYDEVSKLAREPRVNKVYQGGGGARQFIALTDVPNSYLGQAGKYPKVKATEDGLEFGTAGSTSPLTTKGDLYGFSTVDARIPVGTDGKVLQADSSNPLGVSWQTPSTTTPAGSNTQVQFNDSGVFGGDAGFTYDKTTDIATIGGLNLSGQTASRIAIFDASKNVISADTTTYPSLTELSYVKGVTSAIQTQLNGKQASGTYVTGATNSTLTLTGTTLGVTLSNPFTWSATHIFNKADLSAVVPPPANLVITFTPDASGFFANGTNYSYIIYSYANSVYDIVGTSNNSNDPNDASNYYVDLSWDSAGAVDGYYVYDANNNQYVDAGNNTSYQVTPSTPWSFGGAPSSPSTILTPQNSITSQGDKDPATQDINVFEFSSTPLRFYWDYTNQYLRFEDSSLTLKTLRANINADTITGGTYTGTWNGGVISTTKGGTGQSSWTQGDIPYYTSGTSLTKLAKNTTATRYISNTGTSNAPAWAQINLANGVTGDLPFANLAQGSALSVLGVTGNATADVASIAAGTDHQVLRRSGTALAFGSINLASTNAVTGTLPVGNGGTGATTFAQDTLLFGNTTSAVGSATYWKYNETNKQLYWADGGTNSTYGAFYIYDLTHSFKPAMRIDKPTWGSALAITLSTLSPVIEASGGSTFVSYSQSDTGTYLYNAAPTGSSFTIRNDTDNYGTYGLYAKGYNNNSTPSTAGAAKRGVSYGVVGEAQGNATGFGGAGLRSYSASSNIDGVRVDFLSGQTAPLIRARLVDSFYDASQSVATDYFRVEASGSIWNRLTTMQQQWEYDASNYANVTVGSTGTTTFDAVGSGAGFTFSDPVTATQLTSSGLTAGRVTFAGTAGILVDDADFTFATDTLTVTKIVASTSIKTASIVNDTGLASGTYTPTLTGVANVTSTTARLCTYMRVGNTVTVAGQMTITPSGAGVISVGISLPVASNFSTAYQAGGNGHCAAAVTGHGMFIGADATNDRVQADYYDAIGSVDDFSFTFTYEVI